MLLHYLGKLKGQILVDIQLTWLLAAGGTPDWRSWNPFAEHRLKNTDVCGHGLF